jgi:nifR3 family TIM-barrel protein
MNNFWDTLPKPIMVLAPMEDVTDAAFRCLIARTAKPPVMYTEFTSADGLVLAPEKAQPLLRKKLMFSESERPIVAQLFSAYPERIEKAARMVQEMGFDGIDINMGCPVNDVVQTGCGAAMIKNPALAREIMRAAKSGAPDIPLSVKTRIGYDTETLDTWLPELLAEEPAAVILHLRTRKEMSAVPAHWELMPRAVQIRNNLKSKTLILGNGDIVDMADAHTKVAASGCDGAMLGRAIYGNPWLFAAANNPEHRRGAVTRQEKILALIEHLKLFEELLGDTTNYSTMKKHFKAYISGWDHAKDLRVRLMETTSTNEAIAILEKAL